MLLMIFLIYATISQIALSFIFILPNNPKYHPSMLIQMFNLLCSRHRSHFVFFLLCPVLHFCKFHPSLRCFRLRSRCFNLHFASLQLAPSFTLFPRGVDDKQVDVDATFLAVLKKKY